MKGGINSPIVSGKLSIRKNGSGTRLGPGTAEEMS